MKNSTCERRLRRHFQWYSILLAKLSRAQGKWYHVTKLTSSRDGVTELIEVPAEQGHYYLKDKNRLKEAKKKKNDTTEFFQTGKAFSVIKGGHEFGKVLKVAFVQSPGGPESILTSTSKRGREAVSQNIRVFDILVEDGEFVEGSKGDLTFTCTKNCFKAGDFDEWIGGNKDTISVTLEPTTEISTIQSDMCLVSEMNSRGKKVITIKKATTNFNDFPDGITFPTSLTGVHWPHKGNTIEQWGKDIKLDDFRVFTENGVVSSYEGGGEFSFCCPASSDGVTNNPCLGKWLSDLKNIWEENEDYKIVLRNVVVPHTTQPKIVTNSDVQKIQNPTVNAPSEIKLQIPSIAVKNSGDQHKGVNSSQHVDPTVEHVKSKLEKNIRSDSTQAQVVVPQQKPSPEINTKPTKPQVPKIEKKAVVGSSSLAPNSSLASTMSKLEKNIGSSSTDAKAAEAAGEATNVISTEEIHLIFPDAAAAEEENKANVTNTAGCGQLRGSNKKEKGCGFNKFGSLFMCCFN